MFSGGQRGLWKISAQGKLIEHLPLKKNPLALSFCQ
jgi:hypothetical protein